MALPSKLNMDTTNKTEDDVTGTEASETSDPADVGELATSVVINSSVNVSWNTEMDKFDISESDITNMQRQLDCVKEFFQDDSYWPKNAITGKHNTVNDHNRGKMIQVLDSLTHKILFLDKCKVKSGINLELVKDKIDKVLQDLDTLAIEGLSNKNRFQIHDLAKQL